MAKFKDQYTPDKLGWSRTGIHKWKHLNGYVIQRMWTLTKPKKDFFLCYKHEDDYYKGNNFDSRSTLKAAKELFNKMLAQEDKGQ